MRKGSLDSPWSRVQVPPVGALKGMVDLTLVTVTIERCVHPALPGVFPMRSPEILVIFVGVAGMGLTKPCNPVICAVKAKRQWALGKS